MLLGKAQKKMIVLVGVFSLLPLMSCALEVICQIHLQLPIGPSMVDELRHCSVYIVSSATFDISKSTVLSNEELSRIEVLKRSNSSADVLLAVALPFNVTMLSAQPALCVRIGILLRDNSLDGVDLDLDVAQLDHYEQIRYANMLRKLRVLLRDKYRISTTIGCTSLGSSQTLVKAFNEQLDLVSLVGVEMADEALIDAGEEFLMRQYAAEPIRRLIQDGLSANKIVLSLMTVGIVFNPSSYRVSRSLQRSRVGVLSYGQVCELLLELKGKCGSRRRSGCSIFGGKGIVVYDGAKSVEIRVNQAVGFGVRGILVLPNYDDVDGVCDEGPLPLFRNMRAEMAAQRSLPVKQDLLCADGYRYDEAQADGLYYTCFNERRYQQNCCEPGTEFNKLLQICMNINVPPIVLKEDNQSTYAAEVPHTTPLEFTTKDFPTTELTSFTVEQSNSTESCLAESFKNALSALESIVERALAVVLRLEKHESSFHAKSSDFKPSMPLEQEPNGGLDPEGNLHGSKPGATEAEQPEPSSQSPFIWSFS